MPRGTPRRDSVFATWQIAAFLDTSIATVNALIDAGRLRSVHGVSNGVSMSDLQEFFLRECGYTVDSAKFHSYPTMKRVLFVKEIAGRLRVHPSYVRRLFHKRKIAYCRSLRPMRAPLWEIERYLNRVKNHHQLTFDAPLVYSIVWALEEYSYAAADRKRDEFRPR